MIDIDYELECWPRLRAGTEWWSGTEGYRITEDVYLGEYVDVDVFRALGNAPEPGVEPMPEWLVDGMREMLEKQLH